MWPRDWNMPGVPFPGAFRASDADRERVIDLLKTAFVQGWLTRDQLAWHTARALQSRTYAQLAAVTVGLPAARPALNAVAPVRKPVYRKVVAGGAAAIVLATTVWAAFLTYYGGFVILFILAFVGMAMSAGPRPSRHRVGSAPTRTGIRRQ